MKKRGFDADEIAEQSDAPPERTEPAPHAGKAIVVLLASWVLPLSIIVSILTSSEQLQAVRVMHTVIAVVSGALLLVGMGLSIRAIDQTRKNIRMRRRLAYAAFVLALVTPVVWGSELTLAWEVFLTRESLAAETGDAGDGSARPSGPSRPRAGRALPSGSSEASTLVDDASSSPAE